jgi:hypothetical protein
MIFICYETAGGFLEERVARDFLTGGEGFEREDLGGIKEGPMTRGPDEDGSTGKGEMAEETGFFMREEGLLMGGTVFTGTLEEMAPFSAILFFHASLEGNHS